MKYLMIAVAVFAALMQCAYSEGRWKRRTKQICTPSPVADVAFVLDASNSIPKNKFKQVLRFVSDFVDTVEIGPEKVQLGIVHFSLTAQTDMLFNRFHEKERMKEFIDEDLSGENGIRQGKRTNTSGGLYVMRNEIFNPANGARQGVPKVAIVITDGKPNEDEEFTIPNANAAKQDNITIMVVGVGQNAKRKNLEAIASEPHDLNMITVGSVDTLLQEDKSFFDKICETIVLDECPEIVYENSAECEERCPACFVKQHSLQTCHRLITKEMSWADADVFCAERYGARLVSVDSLEEHDELGILMDNSESPNAAYWSSGNDFISRGDFVWAGIGLPVNQSVEAHGGGHCVHVRSNGRLTTADCDSTRGFICEKSYYVGF